LGNATQVYSFDGANGRTTQGGLRLAGDKIYFASTAITGNASTVLGVLDTKTDVATILSTTWNTGGTRTSYNTPLYDATSNAIYTVTLGSTTAGQGGILKWDLNTPTQSVQDSQSILPGSADGLTGNFEDPIIFEGSIFYVKQASTAAANTGGEVWRYDLTAQSSQLVASLNTLGGKTANQSGSLSLVTALDGTQSLYFLTASQTTASPDNGALYRVVPEPATYALLIAGAGLLVQTTRHRKRK
jgi:hypothetical protein